MDVEPEFIQQVSEALGFSASIGPDVIRRALRDAGLPDDRPTPADCARALPQLEARLSTYLTEEDARSRLERLRAFLAQLSGPNEAAQVSQPHN